ncbi:hypothetical protein [Hyalangium minutum]|uniref:Zinc-finger domain-containing protein n=1 Tax=Hyalangium minutum TaxID=394096 RepID=A0A085WG83_9BACT|nr:hypothetical protein [Hyalangium minutum]KFE66696.1 hypothetical protein DB31_8910 [Hyalangium minutum]
MSCDGVAAAILDDGLPRPEGFQAHLDQCPRCRELSRLQASASSLRMPAPPPLQPLSPQSIQGEVRRRQHRRRAVAGTAVAGALAALVFAVSPREVPVAPMKESPVETVLTLPALDLLAEEIASYTQRDPTFDDEIYKPFGMLALWVRPPASTALSDRSFQRAIAPLHPSPTQELAR